MPGKVQRIHTFEGSDLTGLTGPSDTLDCYRLTGGGSAYYVYVTWASTSADCSVELKWAPLSMKRSQTLVSFTPVAKAVLPAGSGTTGFVVESLGPPFVGLALIGATADLQKITLIRVVEVD